jgi:alpha-L-fucosidase
MNGWLARSKELIDKYKPDLHWFDWDGVGSNHATKEAFVSYYYNAACGWGKEVATAGKGGVFPGNDSNANGANIMIHDFETGGKAPAAGSEPKSFWVVDDKIGSIWGYTDGMTYRSAASIVSQIKDYKSRGGMLILNVSPMGDGSLPQAQIDILTAIGNSL